MATTKAVSSANKTAATQRAVTKKGVGNGKSSSRAAGRRKSDAPRRRKEDEAIDRKPAGVGAYVSGLLLKGKSTEEILALVGKQFPQANTSAASVSWYRSKLHTEGKL